MMFSLSWLQQAKTKITSVFVRNYYSGRQNPYFSSAHTAGWANMNPEMVVST